ncbi:hypothetical protein [Methylomonas sp. DH-1]|uniref:hypothetical protein n=1 Tax=Methylomonas sp. (strain DH-1) TaxID=1727196 RepID=UPI0007C897CB|nr:hypothetical protein [Methylomonas sp. DH-1]ANE54776.1 hypothetical protein AYM39_05985 [Methylomonas sp. DH-1]
MLEVEFTGWGNSWYVIFPEVHYSRNYYNYIVSEGEVTGKFLISDEDEKEYRLSNNFGHVHIMQPLLTEGSTISKLIDEGKIDKIDLEHVFFEIKQYRTIFSQIHKRNVFVEVKNSLSPIEPEKPIEQVEVLRESAAMHANRSEDLRTLIMASENFWAKADRDDDTTWPYNDQVADWLKARGFSKRLADMGATIIRPAWAPPGRRSGK